jgi:hypothetical protein
MTLDRRVVVIAVLGVALAGALAMGACGWMAEHDARRKAEALTSVQQKNIDSLKKDESQTEQKLRGQVAEIEKQRQVIMTPTRFVEEMKNANLPRELEVETLTGSAQGGPGMQVREPNAKADAPAEQALVVPKEDLQAIWNAKLTCDEQGARLAACTGMQKDLGQVVTATSTERDAWKTAAQGGSRWHRALGAAKWFALGAGVGLAAEGWHASH